MFKGSKNYQSCWDLDHFLHSKNCGHALEGVFEGDKNLSSQSQNAISKFIDKFQIMWLIKLNDDMCHQRWYDFGKLKFTTFFYS